MTAYARPVRRCRALITVALAASIASSTWAADRDAAARSALAAFLVDESEAGDLNGDGDSTDWVLHVFDARQELTFNLRLAADSVCRSVLGPPFVLCTPVSPLAGRTIIAFLVDEAAQGGTDLNGDGDDSDDVLHVYETTSGTIVNTMLAVAHGLGRDLSSYIFPIMPVVVGDGIALLVGEAEQSASDLNRDGDAEDDVLYVIEPKAGGILNLELAAATVLGPFGSRNPIGLQLDGRRVTFVAGEAEQGGVDLNGDFNADDQVAMVINTQNAHVRVIKSK